MLTGMLFALDLGRMERFYIEVFELQVVDDESSEGFIVLEAEGVRVALHALPDHVAARIALTDPPAAREEVAVKLLFGVEDPSAAIDRVSTAGGQVSHVASEDAADVLDPEGNVLRIQPLP